MIFDDIQLVFSKHPRFTPGLVLKMSNSGKFSRALRAICQSVANNPRNPQNIQTGYNSMST